MTTSGDNPAAGLPKAPELHGVDLGRATSAAAAPGSLSSRSASPGALASGWPSTDQVAAWANEFFKAADGGGAPAVEPSLPSVPGAVSGFAPPDPSTLGRRSSGELPAQPPVVPMFTSATLPTAIVSDPHLGQQLDYRPEVLSSTMVGSPMLGAIDPTGRFTPQPQARGREGIAWAGPVASPSVPYYFINQANAPRDASALDANHANQGSQPALPSLPDPSAVSRRSATELPSMPSVLPLASSATMPNTAASDPRFAQQLGYQPDMLSPTSLGNPQLGGIDPRFGSQPQAAGNPQLGGIDPRFGSQPQAAGNSQLGSIDPRFGSQPQGREGSARVDQAASSSSPYYFLNHANAPHDAKRAHSSTSPVAWAVPSLGATPQADGVTTTRLGDPRIGLDALTGDPVYLAGQAPLSAPNTTGKHGVPALEPSSGVHARHIDSQGAPARHLDTNDSLARPAYDARGSSRNYEDHLTRSFDTGRSPLAQQNDASVRDGVRPRPFEVESVRRDFPILSERVNGKQLVWLDNAATTQKPQAVIDRLAFFYAHENSNIHRAAHGLAARATDAYEDARETVRRFLNAGSPEEIVFVRGTTEGINLIANSWGGRFLEPGDEIIVSRIEHHSNIIPWVLLCERTGARLRVAEVDDTGQVRLDQYERLFNSHTRLVSFTHVSNALGTILPVQAMTQIAHRHGARVVIDGAQSVCHMPVDVQQLDCDFYVFSGHKVFGPTGIGAVYGKKALLHAMPPWQGGGSMIADVTFEKQVYNPPPTRFEAGTGNIADAVGLATALEYLEALGLDNVFRHEHEMLEYGTAKLLEVPGLHLVGTAKEKAAVLGFVLENVPVEQVGAALSAEGIAVRSGHHCAQPALRRFGHEATVRPSLALYNNRADIDRLVGTLHDLQSRWLR